MRINKKEKWELDDLDIPNGRLPFQTPTNLPGKPGQH